MRSLEGVLDVLQQTLDAVALDLADPTVSLGDQVTWDNRHRAIGRLSGAMNLVTVIRQRIKNGKIVDLVEPD